MEKEKKKPSPKKAEETSKEEAELAAAHAEIEELKDKLLRAYAEMDNMRKRHERELERMRRFGIEKFAEALLEVMDNLERALAVEKGNEDALREGISMTLDAWHRVMKKFGLERIDALGEQFDPHVHEALAHVPHEESPGKVVAQHVAGYLLHGRLLRPAKVVVSSGKTETHEPKKGEGLKTDEQTPTKEKTKENLKEAEK